MSVCFTDTGRTAANKREAEVPRRGSPRRGCGRRGWRASSAAACIGRRCQEWVGGFDSSGVHHAPLDVSHPLLHPVLHPAPHPLAGREKAMARGARTEAYLTASRRGQDKRGRHRSAASSRSQLSSENMATYGGNKWQHVATCMVFVANCALKQNMTTCMGFVTRLY